MNGYDSDDELAFYLDVFTSIFVRLTFLFFWIQIYIYC